MTKMIFMLTTALLIGLFTPKAHSSKQADAILGIWINKERNAKFEIYKKSDVYFGKITWGTGGDTLDSNNPDPNFRSRDLVGLTILNDFIFEGDNTWSEGSIYDPKDGKTYSCKLTLVSPNQLEVRGYFGISLFGRTEIWTRIK